MGEFRQTLQHTLGSPHNTERRNLKKENMMDKKEQSESMNYEDRLKLYTGYAEIGRKWTTAMDSKGTFFSAMNAGILALLWGGLKIGQWCSLAFFLGVSATVCSLVALLAAIFVIAPRESLSTLVGKKSPWTSEYKPLSFYGYVASRYGNNGLKNMISEFRKLETDAFVYEALEQHYSISLVVQRKSNWVFRSAIVTLISVLLVIAAILVWAF